MPATIHQAAALAVRDGQICMVTSRSGRRWVLPKGQIEPHQTPTEAALAEAWEEAGLLGTIDPAPVGRFDYEKNETIHIVTVFRMTVTHERKDWPEKLQRQREWVDASTALGRIEEPALCELIARHFAAGADHESNG